MIPPIIEKIISGINNYNDFLRLTTSEIEYKNNEKEGCFKIEEIKNLSIVKDKDGFIKKINIIFLTDQELIIDLDEMELEAFYTSIIRYITVKYKNLLIE